MSRSDNPGLSSEELRYRSRPVEASEVPARAADLLAQPRALDAMRVGLAMSAPGFHVFVSGLLGMGRTAVVRQLIEELAEDRVPGPDRVFVYRHAEPTAPRLVELPAGRGPVFEREAGILLPRLHRAVTEALRERSHASARELPLDGAARAEGRLRAALERRLAETQCVLLDGEEGLDVGVGHRESVWSLRGILDASAEGHLAADEREQLLARRANAARSLDRVLLRLRRLSVRVAGQLRALDANAAGSAVRIAARDFCRRWPQPGIREWIEDVAAFVGDNIDHWQPGSGGPESKEDEEPTEDKTPGCGGGGSATDFGGVSGSGRAGPSAAEGAGAEALLADAIPVHVLTSRSPDAGCPVVVEAQPTFASLFGGVEASRDGYSPFGRIQPGALLSANGGFLILRARDVFREPGVWTQLARVLAVGKLELRDYDPGSGMSIGAVRPEAVSLNVKVVMVGEPNSYDELALDHPQFLRTFKIHAEFDGSVPNDGVHRRRYADYARHLTKEHGLPMLGPDAVASLVEFGARAAGRRDRLTTHFGELADVVHEAAHYALRRNAKVVERVDVERATNQREWRLSLAREQGERDLANGYLEIPTDGVRIGSCTVLTVLDTGTWMFGKPAVVSAVTGVGVAGPAHVLNIEREAELSGPLHDKGVLSLTGYLIDRFGRDGVLCMQATVCVDQVYGGIDGDSASSAELFALLSSLAAVPLRSDLAVTGSVTQHGAIQSVGGINEKVEGWFRLCRARGWTGRQGVLIPRSNVEDLNLAEDVCASVEAGEFSVYPVSDVREGLALLVDGPADDVLGAAGATLRRFRDAAQPKS